MRSISQNSNKQNRAGVTFIELLMVSAVLFVLAFALYATFNNGVKAWQTINQELPEQNINIFFDKFTSDLKNCFNFSSIGFLGSENKIEFAGVVPSSSLNITTVGKIGYVYDSNSGSLIREQSDYSQIYNAEKGSMRKMLGRVKSLRFSFYFYDKEKKDYFWRQDWQGPEMPLAARVEIEVGDDKQISEFTRTVTIPVSG